MQAPNKFHTSATGATQVSGKRLSPPRPRLSILAAFGAALPAHGLVKALKHEKSFSKERVQDFELGIEILMHRGGFLLAVEVVQSHVSESHIFRAAISTWCQRRRRKCRSALDPSRSAAEGSTKWLKAIKVVRALSFLLNEPRM